MLRFFCLAAVLAACALAPAASAGTANIGYDTRGRVVCVKMPNGMLISYAYDNSDNRTSVSTASSSTSCVSHTAGASPPTIPTALPPPPPPPPTTLPPPLALSPTMLSYQINSRGTQVMPVASLGTASDGAALTITSAAMSGPANLCGSVTVTGSQLTYNATLVIPQTQRVYCYVDYQLSHPTGATTGSRVTFYVIGEADPGTGGGGGPPGCPPRGCPNEN